MTIALNESFIDQLKKISARFKRMNHLETRNDQFLKSNLLSLIQEQHPEMHEKDIAILFETVWSHASQKYCPVISREIPKSNADLDNRIITRKTLKKQMRHRR